MKNLILIFSIFCLGSCSYSEKNTSPSSSFFPKFKVGMSWEYEVLEEKIVDAKRTENKYFQKIEITDTLRLNTILYYIINESTKNSELANWKSNNTYTAYQNELGYFLNINQIPYQKIAFPVFLGNEWKYDLTQNTYLQNKAYIAYTNQDYIYKNQRYNDSYVSIIKDDSSGIKNIKEIETYSPQFGLIAAINKDVIYCQETPQCIGKGIVSKSLISSKKLLSFNP